MPVFALVLDGNQLSVSQCAVNIALILCTHCVQDDVCVGGLVVVLSNEDASVVQIALEVFLHYILPYFLEINTDSALISQWYVIYLLISSVMFTLLHF